MENRGGWLMEFLFASFFVVALGCGSQNSAKTELLNVSYDPTRELYRDINERFVQEYEKETGAKIEIKQSHGGSAKQAGAVILGSVEPDVVTLALPSDTDEFRKKGLLAADWETRLENGSLPYTSTIVFVVRKGNPKRIKDWPDLIQEGVQVVTPNPKTSGNGKMSFLAAWGSQIAAGNTDEHALEFVTTLYRHVPVLDSGAREATTTFAQNKTGDVHLTWENEAHFEIKEFPDLEIVYPPRSILAEPKVTVVDTVVDRKGTRAAAEKYLQFLYSDEAQEIIAKHYYRPIRPEVLKRHSADLPPIEFFTIKSFAYGWEDAQNRFFAKNALFDEIQQRK
jgi:sulfate/thiosulfate transport system substrate-binding protein